MIHNDVKELVTAFQAWSRSRQAFSLFARRAAPMALMKRKYHPSRGAAHVAYASEASVFRLAIKTIGEPRNNPHDRERDQRPKH